MDRLLKAALYVPRSEDMWRWADALTACALRRGWDARTHVHTWDDLVELLWGGQADVGLITSRRDLPADRVPRIEAMDEPPPMLLQDGRLRHRPTWG